MSATTAEIDRLFREADAARLRGDAAAFVLALERITQQSEDPRALNALGNHLLNRRQLPEAVVLLERAVRADPSAPILWFNLSLAFAAMENGRAEIEALDRALRLDPYFLRAILHKGRAIERLGDTSVAARIYKDALSCAAAQPQLAEQVPTDMLNHARTVLAQDASALDKLLAEQVAAITARHGHAEHARFSEMMAIFNGRATYQVPRPSFLAYPQLPPIGYHDRASFPWLADIEAATPDVLEEMQNVVAAQDADFTPYVANPEGRPLGQWKELNHSPRWGVYYLWQNGEKVEEHAARCPRTMAAIGSAPQAMVPGNAPNAIFSRLKPRTRIPPHTGMTNTRLVVHLPLVIPENCGFRVGNETRAWVPGTAWVFDDSMEHEAWNLSDQDRIILIFDIWNPYLSAMERDLLCAFFDGLKQHTGSSGLLAETH